MAFEISCKFLEGKNHFYKGACLRYFDKYMCVCVQFNSVLTTNYQAELLNVQRLKTQTTQHIGQTYSNVLSILGNMYLVYFVFGVFGIWCVHFSSVSLAKSHEWL